MRDVAGHGARCRWRRSRSCAAPASMSIGWLRSLVRADAAPAQGRAASTTSNMAGSLARKLTGRRGIPGMHIGEECDLLAVEVRLQATAAHCKARPGDGHGSRGLARLRVGNTFSCSVLDRGGLVGPWVGWWRPRRRAGAVPCRRRRPSLCWRALPSNCRLRSGTRNSGVSQAHRLCAGSRCSSGARKVKTSLPSLVQRDDLEVAQHVVRALGGGLRSARPRDGVHTDQPTAAPQAASTVRVRCASSWHRPSGCSPWAGCSTLPCASSSRSHSSRAAPVPPSRRRPPVGHARGSTDAHWPAPRPGRRAQHGQVGQVVAHEGHGVQPDAHGRPPAAARRPACRFDRGARDGDPQLAAALLGDVLLRAVTNATAMPAWRSSTRPRPSCTWKALALAAVGVVKQAAVGQGAIDIETRQADAGGAVAGYRRGVEVRQE